MPDAFDTGPLSWVKDEIDQSLKKVLASFHQVKQTPSEYPALRFELAHLYQVSGALDMVGLDGCKRYCSEIEKLTDKLSQQSIALSETLMDQLITAVETLSQYLQDLLNGMPDTPLRLYSTLKPLVEAQGESLDESELFFPDVDSSAPRDLPKIAMEESELPIFVAEQRVRFQRALLEWLRNRSQEALEHMRNSMVQVQQAQQKNAPRTLWWVASAFVEALQQDKIAGRLGAKKLCRKLDRQLGHIATGDNRASSQLLRELLYYIAISDAVTDLIARVKKVFSLEQALPQTAASTDIALSSAAERAALAQLLADMPLVKELWSNISAVGMDSAQPDLQAFVVRLEAMLIAARQNISNQLVLQLVAVTGEISQVLQSDNSKLNDACLIEIASALNLIEYGLAHYQRLDAETRRKMEVQIQRLQCLIDGGELPAAKEAFSDFVLDVSVISAVVKQIIDALAEIESALDTYFRNPQHSAILKDAIQPLEQVMAAFDMLELPIPARIVALSRNFVKAFLQADAETAVDVSHQRSYELVAESLSMLGLYAQELPHVRAESTQALADALVRMEQGAALLQLNMSGLNVEQSLHTEQAADHALSLAEVSVTESAPVNRLSATEQNFSHDEDGARKADTSLRVDTAFDAELENIFLAEAEEVLATLAQNLQALRVNATDVEALQQVRRAFHTLKGSGRTVGLKAMGEVAWSLENLLNELIERKIFPDAPMLSFMEKATAAFAGWVAELYRQHQVQLHPLQYTEQADQLLTALDQPAVKSAPQKEEVLIGGTRRLGKAFFEIFLSEAEQHVKTLQAARGRQVLDSSEIYRAAHTLGSNALTAGFTPIGELARALECWLNAHNSTWNEQHIELYNHVVKALQDGLQSIRALKAPKTKRALIKALAKSTEAMQTEAAQKAEAAMIAAEQTEKVARKSAKKIVPIRPNVVSASDSFVESDIPPLAREALSNEPVVNEELLTMFLEEARELVPQIGKDLRHWRANPNEHEFIDSLQRALHTLKGSARMAGLSAIGNGVHGMEDHVIRMLKGQISSDDFERMFHAFDQIGMLLDEASGGSLSSHAAHAPISEESSGKASTRKTAAAKSQFLRMRAEMLDRLINEAGEISIMRSRMDREMQHFKQSSTDLTDSITRLRSYLRELEIEAETQLQSRMTLMQESDEAFDPLEFDRFTRLQELTRMMAESVNDVSTIQHSLQTNLDQTEAALQQQNRMNRELQQGLMRVRMLPFATISERLQRIVRQTARELNKRVEMTIDGEHVELDRGVLDKLGQPLEHLLRNAVAHGLETEQERLLAGKSEIGHINLRLSMENDEITLVITDDGAGINLDKVRQKAIEKGISADEQTLNEQSLMTLIFEPGFSTADSISQIAGRGVGLDAVRSDIAALGGRIDVSNVVGSGAMFSIYLPVTLSVAQVALVKSGRHTFAIPTVMIEQVQKLKLQALQDAYQAGNIQWAGRDYPLHFLSRLVGDHDHEPLPHLYTPVILMRSGTYRTALHVDEILGNQEVVMKPMGTQLSYVPGMIGASVLGDGAIVLVINAVQLANREVFAAGTVRVAVAPVVENTKPVVLVVDDSLTMRKVLSRVLEREDYEVVTANDGVDAIQRLQEVTPTIILTDIEMPRMDGFEFARYVRDNPATKNIPIIVISSRTADKHRTVAAEIGVNVFLGKPVQDEDLIAQVKALTKPAPTPDL